MGAPRVLARAAASSRAAAIWVSGRSVESARWRARSIGSSTNRRNASVRVPPLVGGHAVVDDRREQRVREAHRPVRALDHMRRRVRASSTSSVTPRLDEKLGGRTAHRRYEQSAR